MSPPPFPADVPTAPLPRLSWSKLSQSDSDESRRLLDASIEHGFFLLDLTETPDGASLLSNVAEAHEIGKRFFAEDLEVKKEYKVNSGNVGYASPLSVQSILMSDLTVVQIQAFGCNETCRWQD